MADDYIRKADAIKQCGFGMTSLHIANNLRKMPPADVVQVVHAHWIYHMSFGVCKKCGYEYEWKGTDAKNYCPNCGAKMDAQGEE